MLVMNKKIILLLSTVLTLILLQQSAMAAGENWWDASWGGRQFITLNPNFDMVRGNVYNLTMNITDINSDLETDGKDLRVIYRNATEANTTILFKNSTYSIVSFMAQRNMTAAATDSQNYSLYYDNPSALMPPLRLFSIFQEYYANSSNITHCATTGFDILINDTDAWIVYQGRMDDDIALEVMLREYNYITNTFGRIVNVTVPSSEANGVEDVHPAMAYINDTYFVLYEHNYPADTISYRTSNNFTTWGNGQDYGDSGSSGQTWIGEWNSTHHAMLWTVSSGVNGKFINSTSEQVTDTTFTFVAGQSSIKDGVSSIAFNERRFIYFHSESTRKHYMVNCSYSDACDTTDEFTSPIETYGRHDQAIGAVGTSMSTHLFGNITIALADRNQTDLPGPNVNMGEIFNGTIQNGANFDRYTTIWDIANPAPAGEWKTQGVHAAKTDSHHMVVSYAWDGNVFLVEPLWLFASYVKVNWYSGENTTTPTLFNETADTLPPTFSGYTANTTLIGEPINFSVTITDESELSGYIFETNNTVDWVNGSWTVLASGGLAQGITTLNSTVGTVVNITFYANDSSDNWGVYRNSVTTTGDVTAPAFSGYSANTTLIDTPVNISITITDETELAGYIFESNNTGQLSNSTWTALASGGLAQNITTLNDTNGVIISITFFANDSSNNWATYSTTLTTTDVPPAEEEEEPDLRFPFLFDVETYSLFNTVFGNPLLLGIFALIFLYIFGLVMKLPFEPLTLALYFGIMFLISTFIPFLAPIVIFLGLGIFVGVFFFYRILAK